MEAINSALDQPDPNVLMRALQMPAAELPPVMPTAGPLYHQELRSMKAEKAVSLQDLMLNYNVAIPKNIPTFTKICSTDLKLQVTLYW